MEEKELSDLIDEYLLGRIQERDLDRLEYLRKTNPDVDLNIIQSKKAFRILQYARYQHLRQKLRQIDASGKQTTNRSSLTRCMLGGAAFIIIIIGFWKLCLEHCRPASLAVRQFENISTGDLWGDKINEEEVKNWEKACKAFQEKDFQMAIFLFDPFLENSNTRVAAYSHWNILLARLSLEGPSGNWKYEMKQFEALAPDPLGAKVSALLRLTNSPFYQRFILQWSPQFSALKPRLM